MSLKKSGAQVFVFLFVTAIIASLYVAGMFAGLLPSPSTCTTLEKQTIAGPDDVTIEMVLSNCDLIAKWERVAISGKQRGDLSKTRLFEYDPAYDTTVPQIAFSNGKDIVISVQAIDSVVLSTRHLEGPPALLSYRQDLLS